MNMRICTVPWKVHSCSCCAPAREEMHIGMSSLPRPRAAETDFPAHAPVGADITCKPPLCSMDGAALRFAGKSLQNIFGKKQTATTFAYCLSVLGLARFAARRA